MSVGGRRLLRSAALRAEALAIDLTKRLPGDVACLETYLTLLLELRMVEGCAPGCFERVGGEAPGKARGIDLEPAVEHLLIRGEARAEVATGVAVADLSDANAGELLEDARDAAADVGVAVKPRLELACDGLRKDADEDVGAEPRSFTPS